MLAELPHLTDPLGQFHPFVSLDAKGELTTRDQSGTINLFSAEDMLCLSINCPPIHIESHQMDTISEFLRTKIAYSKQPDFCDLSLMM